jgi:1-aminocyclopropane-1-carboxylate deaminase
VDFSAIKVQPIEAEWLTSKQVSLDVLRLDRIDPFVSGNKWYKLKYYLEEAIHLQRSTIATFGGAWSNHIVATAFAARQAGLQSVGFIRGEKPKVLSRSLQLAEGSGMDLYFVSREQYRKKEELPQAFVSEDWYWIGEGGYGFLGAKGASEILTTIDTDRYSHIIAPVGTGTMLAGLVSACKTGQAVVGISSMKGNASIEQRIKKLTADQTIETSFVINHDYHFGGYGKHPPPLIAFINEVYHTLDLPLDIVYTGKTFYATRDLVANNYFMPGSRLLMIHSGGLLGNRSLPPEVLLF